MNGNEMASCRKTSSISLLLSQAFNNVELLPGPRWSIEQCTEATF